MIDATKFEKKHKDSENCREGWGYRGKLRRVALQYEFRKTEIKEAFKDN